MNLRIFLFICLIISVFTCFSQVESTQINEDLIIEHLSNSIWVHKSYTTQAPYGRFYSNGLIYVVDNQAIVFDTPYSESLTEDLIHWLNKEKNIEIKGIVVNHFHDDCLMGLSFFHDKGIPSYSSFRTQELAEKNGKTIPQYGFRKKMVLKLSGKKIINYYPGEAHSPDNIVSYLPDEEVLFGGCMVKSLKSGKGNLGDANVSEWSHSVGRVKRKFPKATVVIPGHGKYGDQELLDYTIGMFGGDGKP